MTIFFNLVTFPSCRSKRSLGRTMECLVSSTNFGVFSKQPGRGTHEKESIHGYSGKPLSFFGQNSGLLSTSIFADEIDVPVASASSNCDHGAGLELPTKGITKSGSSIPDESRTSTTLGETPLFEPNVEMQAVFNAHLGGGGGLANGRIENAGDAAQAPGALVVSPETGEWGGAACGTRDENRLAAEDWLDVAHALSDTVTDP